MTKASRAEAAFLAASIVLYVAGFFLGVPLDFHRSAVFLPAGLLALALTNVRLRSRVLAWSAFTVSFVLFMTVFGPWVLGLRSTVDADTPKFMRAMALYVALSLTALCQLRAARGG